MLNFIKCKKLKEAGFPQDIRRNPLLDNETWLPHKRGGSWFYFVSPELEKYAAENNGQYAGCIGFDFIEEGDPKWIEFVQDYYAAPEEQRAELFGEWTKAPELNELMSEIKLRDFSLERMVQDIGWLAKAKELEELEYTIVNGDIPEEAVANLWLELNKKPV